MNVKHWTQVLVATITLFAAVAGIAPAAPVESDAGPTVTHLGIASGSSDSPVEPRPEPEGGRFVYEWPQGQGFRLVVEARPGNSGRPVGLDAFKYDPDDPTVLPDLQVLLSQSVGTGDATVCESEGAIGIPGVPSLGFAPTRTVADAINDLGCRFLNGENQTVGRLADDACTGLPPTFDPAFVDPTTTAQFCALIDAAWPFPRGDTIVAARVRDTAGNIGPRQEIILRVTGFGPTPTITETATPTPSRTPTPTRTLSPMPPACVGDCNGDRVVTLDELIRGVNIALDVFPVNRCPAFDHNGSGEVTINELTAAVNAALDACE